MKNLIIPYELAVKAKLNAKQRVIEEKRLEILLDTINYFDSSKLNIENGYECKYYPVNKSKEGCAIGRLIEDKKLCEELDSEKLTDVGTIFNKLPNNLKELGEDFLIDLQNLHDRSNNWGEDGLSEIGYPYFIDMLIDHC